MKRHIVSMTNLLLACAAVYAADAKPGASVDAKAAFARLKSLSGEWQGDTSMGKVQLTYELIAGGSVVVERESGEKMPVMITVYHLDGDRLLLTHYCAAGNQPRMEARGFNPETGEIQFRFLDATNLSAGGGHMRNATIRFVDDNHLLAAWEFHENGQLKSTETARYTRVR